MITSIAAPFQIPNFLSTGDSNTPFGINMWDMDSVKMVNADIGIWNIFDTIVFTNNQSYRFAIGDGKDGGLFFLNGYDARMIWKGPIRGIHFDMMSDGSGFTIYWISGTTLYYYIIADITTIQFNQYGNIIMQASAIRTVDLSDLFSAPTIWRIGSSTVSCMTIMETDSTKPKPYILQTFSRMKRNDTPTGKDVYQLNDQFAGITKITTDATATNPGSFSGSTLTMKTPEATADHRSVSYEHIYLLAVMTRSNNTNTLAPYYWAHVRTTNGIFEGESLIDSTYYGILDASNMDTGLLLIDTRTTGKDAFGFSGSSDAPISVRYMKATLPTQYVNDKGQITNFSASANVYSIGMIDNVCADLELYTAPNADAQSFDPTYIKNNQILFALITDGSSSNYYVAYWISNGARESCTSLASYPAIPIEIQPAIGKVDPYMPRVGRMYRSNKYIMWLADKTYYLQCNHRTTDGTGSVTTSESLYFIERTEHPIYTKDDLPGITFSPLWHTYEVNPDTGNPSIFIAPDAIIIYTPTGRRAFARAPEDTTRFGRIFYTATCSSFFVPHSTGIAVFSLAGPRAINTYVPMLGPTFDDLYERIQHLNDRISALEGMIRTETITYTDGPVNECIVWNRKIGSGSGDVSNDRFLAEGGYSIIPDIRRGTFIDKDGTNREAAVMKIGNFIDFHVPNTANNEGKHSEKDHDNCSTDNDFCARIYADKNNSLIIKANGLYYQPLNGTSSYPIDEHEIDI